jgi:beta-phosphoglucomutase-like phosphatase (HAD superfamily)
VTGCTVHLVDAGIDEGPILAQAAVPVLEGDTLETLGDRVHAAEHALYPATVRRFLLDPFTLEGRRVRWAGAVVTLAAAGASSSPWAAPASDRPRLRRRRVAARRAPSRTGWRAASARPPCPRNLLARTLVRRPVAGLLRGMPRGRAAAADRTPSSPSWSSFTAATTSGAASCRDARTLRGLLTRGYRGAAISNSDGRAEEVLANVGFAHEFEFVLDSRDLGVEKPDPRIFLDACARLDLPPGRCAYVGDVVAVDVEAARGAGLHPVLFDAYGAYDAATSGGAPRAAEARAVAGLFPIAARTRAAGSASR